MREKELKVDISFLSIAGCIPGDQLISQGSQGRPLGLDHWREGSAGHAATSAQMLAGPSPPQSCTWGEIPARSPVHLLRGTGSPVWPGSSVGSSAWFGSPANRAVLVTETALLSHLSRAANAKPHVLLRIILPDQEAQPEEAGSSSANQQSPASVSDWSLVDSSAWLRPWTNRPHWPRSLPRVWEWFHSPVQLLNMASSPMRSGSLTRECEQPKSSFYSCAWTGNDANGSAQLLSTASGPMWHIL